MKIGIEVEGRFKGLRTLFLTADEVFVPTIHKVCSQYRIQQIYVTDHEPAKVDLNDPVLVALSKVPLVITVERTRINSEEVLAPEVHLILHHESASVLKLRDTDQVKVGFQKYVWLTSVEQMSKTRFTDYVNDRELK